MKMLLVYMLVMNIFGLWMMYMDKEKAKKGKYRIPEERLWQIAIAGGAIGGTVGMKVFNHKTKHIKFKYGFPFLSLIYIGIVVYFIIN